MGPLKLQVLDVFVRGDLEDKPVKKHFHSKVFRIKRSPVSYGILITDTKLGQRWIVQHRYSDLRNLRKSITPLPMLRTTCSRCFLLAAETANVPFPRRRWSSHNNHQIQQRRAEELQVFLSRLLQLYSTYHRPNSKCDQCKYVEDSLTKALLLPSVLRAGDSAYVCRKSDLGFGEHRGSLDTVLESFSSYDD